MGPGVGDLLPPTISAAMSPIPVIAVILMLLAPQAGASSMGFAAVWTVGIVLVTGTSVTGEGLGGSLFRASRQ